MPTGVVKWVKSKGTNMKLKSIWPLLQMILNKIE